MIKTTAMLIEELNQYARPADKITRLVKEGQVVPVVRGLYETDPAVSGHLLAMIIYGPSYLSFEYALSDHGLIPEAVYTFTSATFEKKKKKHYETPFGLYTYRDVPSAVFPLGVELRKEGEYSFMIATAEKALCDQLYKLSPLANYGELESLLFDDLRVDREGFNNLSVDDVTELSKKYGSTNVKKLAGYMRRTIA